MTFVVGAPSVRERAIRAYKESVDSETEWATKMLNRWLKDAGIDFEAHSPEVEFDGVWLRSTLRGVCYVLTCPKCLRNNYIPVFSLKHLGHLISDNDSGKGEQYCEKCHPPIHQQTDADRLIRALDAMIDRRIETKMGD